MNNYFANGIARKVFVASALIISSLSTFAQSGDAKMDAFISKLMSKMTLG